MIRDVNAKWSNWSSNDTTIAEGAQLDYLTSLYGMKQVITEPNIYFGKLFWLHRSYLF